MKSRSRTIAAGILLSIALLGAASAKADSIGGAFTLPFAVNWGNSVLPAGRYSFTIVSSIGSVRYLDVHGAKIGAFILAARTAYEPAPVHDLLTVVTAGSDRYVQKLTLKDAGITLEFLNPAMKAEKNSRRANSRTDLGG